MKAITIFIGAVSAIGASAAMVPSYVWDVTHFQLHCSPGGCSDEFRLTAPEHGKVPALNVTCFAVAGQSGWAGCEGNDYITHKFDFAGKNSRYLLLDYRYEDYRVKYVGHYETDAGMPQHHMAVTPTKKN